VKKLLIGLALFAAACSSSTNTTPSPTYTVTIAPSTSPATAFPTGAYNPDVTQATIKTTICVRGYTATIRPRLSTRRGYQHDHFIPLELGGAPKDPNNLWFVPIDRAHKDDQEENELHREVCSGRITLAEAQQEMINWKTH